MANRGIFPKSKEIDRILDNLTKETSTLTEPKTAQAFGNYKPIRYYRDYIYIGRDDRNGKTIIRTETPIIKIGKKYYLPKV